MKTYDIYSPDGKLFKTIKADDILNDYTPEDFWGKSDHIGYKAVEYINRAKQYDVLMTIPKNFVTMQRREIG